MGLNAAARIEPAAPSSGGHVFPHDFSVSHLPQYRNYSEAAVHSNFESELQSGQLVWRVINVDEPENKFIKDYQLYSKHLIVSE
ncbi:MAG: hypothetical protein R2874_15425 [Desulfobacterales bacterium]